jgi:uncharacterized protein (DUF1330 family)
MPKGYIVARIVVTDPEKYAEYVKDASEAIRKYGGRPLVRGGAYEELEGEGRPRNVVIEFESFEQAKRYYHSPEYQAAAEFRRRAAIADLVIVTDDNPRSEEPTAVRAAILSGTSGGGAEVLEIGDRRAAIAEAVRRAGAGDVVLIAGKGHETGQEVAGVVHPFDDRVVAREELRR